MVTLTGPGQGPIYIYIYIYTEHIYTIYVPHDLVVETIVGSLRPPLFSDTRSKMCYSQKSYVVKSHQNLGDDTVSDRIIENKKGSVETANLRKKRCVISVKKCAGFFSIIVFSIIQSEGRWSFHIFHN